jgi:hypothetical protein
MKFVNADRPLAVGISVTGTIYAALCPAGSAGKGPGIPRAFSCAAKVPCDDRIGIE